MFSFRSLPNARVVLGGSLAVIVILLLTSGGCGERSQMVNAVAFSPDGKWLAAGLINSRDANTPGKHYEADVCRTVGLIPVASPGDAVIAAQETRSGNQGPLSRTTPAFAFAPDGASLQILVPRSGALQRYDLVRGELEEIAEPYAREIWGFVCAADGSLMAIGGNEGIVVWDVARRERLAAFHDVHQPYFRQASTMELSPDGRLLAMRDSYPDGLIDPRTGRKLADFPQQKSQIERMRFSPDGRLIAAVIGGRIFVWKTAEILDGTAEENVALPEAVDVQDFAFSPDGRQLAACGGGGLQILDVTTRAAIASRSWSSMPTSVAWASRSGVIATGDLEGNAILWNERTLDRIRAIPLRGVTRMDTMIPVTLLVVWGIAALWVRDRAAARLP